MRVQQLNFQNKLNVDVPGMVPTFKKCPYKMRDANSLRVGLLASPKIGIFITPHHPSNLHFSISDHKLEFRTNLWDD